MQRWEYSVFASHLDPAELVVLLNRFGSEGWELVTMVAVTDHHLPEVVELMPTVPTPEPDDVEELIPVDAFRYILKRPLEMREVRDKTPELRASQAPGTEGVAVADDFSSVEADPDQARIEAGH